MPQPEKNAGCSRSAATIARPILARDPGEQHLAGVRRAHPARLACRRRAPARRCRAPAHQNARSNRAASCSACASACARVRCQTEPARAARRQLLGGVDVTLDLGQRDRAFGQRAVGVKDRVVGILPALIGEPLFGRAVIFDEAVAVRIAGPSIQPSAPRSRATARASVSSSPVRST